MERKFKWVGIVTLLAFVISVIMSLLSTIVLNNVSLLIAIIVTFIFIFLGIIFDIVGVAVTCGDITVFNSMSARKIKGGKVGVNLIKNNSKVSSVCCDVIGDVCGIVSGATGVVIVNLITKLTDINTLIVTVLVSAIISSLTIGGKAVGKGFAVQKSTDVIKTVSKILAIFSK